MPPPKPAYDIDWIFSNNSNVHVANHRDWFTSYTPFVTSFDSGMTGPFSGNDVRVEGIGDVELTTKTHPTRSGTAFQATIVLRDVLYAPSAFCNILGQSLMEDHNVSFNSGPGKSKVISIKSGACVGLIDRNILYRLRLRGQSANQTTLDPNSLYVIRATWAAGERAKWESFRLGYGRQVHTRQAGASNNSPSLTQEEKKWLKENYGDEYHFLRDYGLSIFKDEDRDEARRLLRAFMDDHDEKIGQRAEDTDDDEDNSLDSFQRDLADPTSHVADYHFSEEQLDWIKSSFGHSGNFLLSYGLKPWNDEDCLEGKAILQTMSSGHGEAAAT
ncbi:MAG: hypothetical protein LQ338_000859 [Usnochroma carphineum]|nr:MAG: hypothetical protein LQ338_000859 [Usnochroma carphineum]